MSPQPMLLGPVVHEQPRDPLERHYTPIGLAAACLARLPDLRMPRVLEPSVGGGAFVRAARQRWAGCAVVAVDLDPGAEGFALADVALHQDFVSGLDVGPCDIAVGNPPFADGVAHVRRALEAAPLVAFILPIAKIEGGHAWGAWLDVHAPEVVYPIAGRWNAVARGLGLWVWTRCSGAYRIGPRIEGWRQ